MKKLKDFINEALGEDYEVHSVYNRDKPLNMDINSKNEIIFTHLNTIQFYTNSLYNKINEIKIEINDIIRDFIIIDDYLLVATDSGKLFKYKRDEDYKYSEINVKIFDIKFRFILKLKEKNLICGFTKSKIYIINIEDFSINSKMLLGNSFYIDLKTKPFIISNKNHTICFREQSQISIFNYKKMQIVKTIELKSNAPFQIFKEEKAKFFYLISIVFSNLDENEYCKTYIEAIKFDINLQILEKFKTKIKMPKFIDDNMGYEEESEEYSNGSIPYYNHYCIYRCIVKNVKNYTFILHGYRGPPFEAEWFWTVECKNGKIQEIEDHIVYNYLSGSLKNIDLVFNKYKNKNILAYADVEDNIIIIK